MPVMKTGRRRPGATALAVAPASQSHVISTAVSFTRSTSRLVGAPGATKMSSSRMLTSVLYAAVWPVPCLVASL